MSSRDWAEVFKWFHANPELSLQETGTTAQIRAILEEEGIEILPSGLATGLIAVIHGGQEGKSVCLRADIDALPIQEQTGLPYSSQHPNIMHACGHDFHITVALAAASKLNLLRDQIKGTLYLAFQPAEEIFQGAERVWETGLLGHISEFYGFHTDPALKVGEVGVKSGGVMAAVDRFRIDVKGVGTHGATPHLGNNPIPILTSIISAIQTFAVRELAPNQSKVLSFTHIEGGNTWNIIPETAFCEGTVRTLRRQDRDSIQASISRTVQGFSELTGADCRLDWIAGPAAVINSDGLCQLAREAADEVGLKAVDFIPEMISDDFSFYTEQSANAQGLYLKIGTGIGSPLHHPKFQVDPTAIDGAAELIAKLMQKALA